MSDRMVKGGAADPVYVINDELPINIPSMPLPEGAVTASNQTSGAAKTQIVLSDGTTEVDVFHPFKVDGDSVYSVDIAEAYCTKTGWTGDYSSLFDCPNTPTEMYNNTATNPKVLYIAFCRTLYCNAIGLGCNTGKTFSNVKLEFIGSDGTVRYTYNDGTNNTKYGTRLYSFAPTACIAIRFSFLTADTVGLTNITIQKESSVASRLRAMKPNGTVTDVDATAGGNLKFSLEEIEAGVIIPSSQSGTWNNQIVTGATVATVEARKQTPTGNALNVQIGPGDVISNVPVTIDYDHHQIHEGESYSYCNLQTGGLASGSNFDIRISVPVLAATTRTPHIVFEIIASGECEAYLHSGVTWTSGGTAAAASATSTAKDNRNHNSANAANTALYVNGATALTVNSTGTVRYIWYLVSAGQKTATGDRSLNEIDLASNTEYMLRITSRATGLKFLIRVDWYEDLGV